MTDQWIPPSQQRPLKIDCAGLGIPRASYVLPHVSDYWEVTGAAPGADETYQAFANLERHFKGEVLLADLPARDVQFLRDFFGGQARERQERVMRNFNERVPKRYTNAEPDAIARAWAKNAVHTPDTTRSLMIVGPTGTGKTHRAYGVLRAVAEAGSTAWTALTAADLYARLRPRAGQDSETQFEGIVKTGVLFVDDLAAAKLTEWTEEVTYRLINKRYEQCIPSIFTSNVPPAEPR